MIRPSLHQMLTFLWVHFAEQILHFFIYLLTAAHEMVHAGAADINKQIQLTVRTWYSFKSPSVFKCALQRGTPVEIRGQDFHFDLIVHCFE